MYITLKHPWDRSLFILMQNIFYSIPYILMLILLTLPYSRTFIPFHTYTYTSCLYSHKDHPIIIQIHIPHVHNIHSYQ